MVRRLHPNCSEWDNDLEDDITEEDKLEVAKIKVNIDRKLVSFSQVKKKDNEEE